MRQPDLNRVNKAKEHLKAARTLLDHIRWENTNTMEDHFLAEAKRKMIDASFPLDDIINIQGDKK